MMLQKCEIKDECLDFLMQNIVLLKEKHLEMPIRREKNYEEIADFFCERSAVNGAYLSKECAAFSFLLEV